MFKNMLREAVTLRNAAATTDLFLLRRTGILRAAFEKARDTFGVDVDIEEDTSVVVARAECFPLRFKQAIVYNPNSRVFDYLSEEALYAFGLVIAFHELGHLAIGGGRSKQTEKACDRISGYGARLVGVDVRLILRILKGLPEDAEHPAGSIRAYYFKLGWLGPGLVRPVIRNWQQRQTKDNAVAKFLIGAAIVTATGSLLKSMMKK